MKIKIFFLVLFLTFIFSFFLSVNRDYDLKMKIVAKNVSAQDIDSIFAHNINEEILKLSQIKDLMIISSDEKMVAYVKFKLFQKIFQKQETIDRIIRKINNLKNDFPNDIELSYHDDLNLKYSSFFIISTNESYEILDKYSNLILKELLSLKTHLNILNMANYEFASYIYYTPSVLKKYNLDLGSIKELIKQDNILKSLACFEEGKNKIDKNVSTRVKSLHDLKEIAFSLGQKNQIYKFGDIFEFENHILFPCEFAIELDDKKSVVYAISKKWYYPQFLLDIKLSSLRNKFSKQFPDYVDVNYQNLKYKKRIELYVDINSSLNNTIDLKRKIETHLKNKNILYFIGASTPKIYGHDVFFENKKYKLTVFLNYLDYFKNRNFLKRFELRIKQRKTFSSFSINELQNMVDNYIAKNSKQSFLNFLTYKQKRVDYHINSNFQKRYMLGKQEILSAINSYNQGQVLDYYFINHNRIPIVLKVKEKSENIFVYSKALKTLVFLNAFCNMEINDKYYSITRRNGKYYTEVFSY